MYSQVGKVKLSLHMSLKWPILLALMIPLFLSSVWRLGGFQLPPVWDASPLQGYRPAIKFAGTHLSSWRHPFKQLEVERDTESIIKVSCLRTQNTQPGLKPRPHDHEMSTLTNWGFNSPPQTMRSIILTNIYLLHHFPPHPSFYPLLKSHLSLPHLLYDDGTELQVWLSTSLFFFPFNIKNNEVLCINSLYVIYRERPVWLYTIITKRQIIKHGHVCHLQHYSKVIYHLPSCFISRQESHLMI